MWECAADVQTAGSCASPPSRRAATMLIYLALGDWQNQKHLLCEPIPVNLRQANAHVSNQCKLYRSNCHVRCCPCSSARLKRTSALSGGLSNLLRLQAGGWPLAAGMSQMLFLSVATRILRCLLRQLLLEGLGVPVDAQPSQLKGYLRGLRRCFTATHAIGDFLTIQDWDVSLS